jgi:hypothetical protein
MSPASFRNYTAAFLWGFAALWLAMLCAVTHVFLRDGPPSGLSSPGMVAILAIFWTAGIGLAVLSSSQPCVSVLVTDDGSVLTTLRYPHKVVRKQVQGALVHPAARGCISAAPRSIWSHQC